MSCWKNPASNPHADSPIFALGFREPRGLTFDPQTDVAFITERSGNGIHVIDRVVGASNYGWPNIVGLPDTPDELAFVANHPEYVPPLLESHSQFVGAAFNPSAKYGHATVLDLFYGVNDLAHIVALALSPERTASAEARTFATGLPTPMTAVAFSPAGTLYVATQSAVLRIVLFQ